MKFSRKKINRMLWLIKNTILELAIYVAMAIVMTFAIFLIISLPEIIAFIIFG